MTVYGDNLLDNKFLDKINKRNYTVTCNKCDYMHNGIDRKKVFDLARNHKSLHDHEVKVVTYESREVVVGEEYI